MILPAPAPVPTPISTAASTVPALSESDDNGQAASNLIAGNISEETVQQILDMGGGTWDWDRDIVIRALRTTYNNPERAVEYLYSVIPEPVEAPLVPRSPFIEQAANPPVQAQVAPVPSSGPNVNPLDLFPQGVSNVGPVTAGASNLDFLRNSAQFQALRAMVQANPQVLQPMLQELGKRNPNLLRLIQKHRTDFLSLINEPVEGGDGNPLGHLAAAMPQTIAFTPEEHEAIERVNSAFLVFCLAFIRRSLVNSFGSLIA